MQATKNSNFGKCPLRSYLYGQRQEKSDQPLSNNELFSLIAHDNTDMEFW